MKSVLLAIFLLLTSSYGSSASSIEKQESSGRGNISIIYINEIKKYQFTKRNIADFKFFLQKNIEIIEKNSIYSVLRELNSNFEGGEIVPKKLFTPITKGYFTYSYLFGKSIKENFEIHGYYDSSFDKKTKNFWKTATIFPVAERIAMNSEFTQKDFDDLNLVFKQKYFLKDLLLKNTLSSLAGYSDSYFKATGRFEAIEKNCYAIYRFERKDEKAHLQFDFCVSRNNYQETDKYPYRFGKIVIERLDEPKSPNYKIVPYKAKTLPNWGQ
ncbi:hypothetical protein [Avibacterium sp. 21-599]|uniref:hypothetical protein n=1 Tax=Avibacterium sp. 21-599 TaxID=2911528 RepID=UPI002247055A|nr:hypothetical protein [Avibacterium sp. 21-599]MCW9718655.1 hypothetical protein [Avibacterium sp. 21-599]